MYILVIGHDLDNSQVFLRVTQGNYFTPFDPRCRKRRPVLPGHERKDGSRWKLRAFESDVKRIHKYYYEHNQWPSLVIYERPPLKCSQTRLTSRLTRDSSTRFLHIYDRSATFNPRHCVVHKSNFHSIISLTTFWWEEFSFIMRQWLE